MIRQSHSANSQPFGCVSAVALAQTVPLRLFAMADAFRGAAGQRVIDACSFSARIRGGIHTDRRVPARGSVEYPALMAARAGRLFNGNRSEERRVGKECRSRGAPDHLKKKR